MQGRYAYANKYIPKTVTQSMMRTNTYTSRNNVSENMKPVSKNTLLRDLPKDMVDHLREVDEKTKHSFYHQRADQTDYINTTPSNDHQVRDDYMTPSSDATNTITANRRAAMLSPVS
jgi:ssDNA-specific exonuclease RecJ